MTIFMVERDLTGISLEALVDAQKAAMATAAKMSSEGIPMRYLRSTFAPGDGRCMCLMEAPSVADVACLNDDAMLPYFRIVEALDLPAP
jgi:hypothetical protein